MCSHGADTPRRRYTVRCAMTICPIAIVVGCRKCPMFSVCPVKSVIGDYKPPAEERDARPSDNEKTVEIERDRPE